MLMQLSETERRLVLDLLESRLAELPAEIRRAPEDCMRDQRQDEMEALERLARRLQESPYDVLC